MVLTYVIIFYQQRNYFLLDKPMFHPNVSRQEANLQTLHEIVECNKYILIPKFRTVGQPGLYIDPLVCDFQNRGTLRLEIYIVCGFHPSQSNNSTINSMNLMNTNFMADVTENIELKVYFQSSFSILLHNF